MKLVFGHTRFTSSTVPWQFGFVRSISRELEKLGVDIIDVAWPRETDRYKEETWEIIEKVPDGLPWLLDTVGVYWFSDLLKKEKKVSLLTGFTHGFLILGCDDWLISDDLEEQTRERLKSFDVIFSACDWTSRMNAERFGLEISKFVPTGYPLDLTELEPYRGKPKEDLIMISGRMVFEKPPVLAAYMLWPFRESCRIVFSTPEYPDLVAEEDPNQFLIAMALRRRGFEVLFAPPRDEYLDLVSRAKVSFSCSLADTFNVCIAEAAYLGSQIVVPDVGPFSDLWPKKVRYPAYDMREAQAHIQHALEGHRYVVPPVYVEENYGAEVVVKRMAKEIQSRL